jgi:hypothetical protein
MAQHDLLIGMMVLCAGEVSRKGSSEHPETIDITCAANQAIPGKLLHSTVSR